MKYILHLLIPSTDWIYTLNKKIIREDLISGVIAAILIIPQAVALATLAGMPPQYGVYASIFPVMVAAIWGSSYQSISGPNTALALLVMSALLPLGNVGTKEYIGFALTLAFLVGIIQILMSFLKFGNILEFISSSIVAAISNAVGIMIMVYAGWGFLGIFTSVDGPLWVKVWNLSHDIFRPNYYALLIGATTVVSGLIARRYIRRYSLVIAMIAGVLTERTLAFLFGIANTNIELMGNIQLLLFPVSMPTFSIDDFVIWKLLITSALGIAFVGVLQTVVIAKSLAEKTGQNVNINKEIFGQGLSNFIASFFSGFPGSASFNRSQAHYESGANTPLAAFSSGIFLFLLVFVVGKYTAFLSTPTISGVLILVGYSLINFSDFKSACSERSECFIFYSVLFITLIFSIADGVLFGFCLSVYIYLSKTSKPIIIEEISDAKGPTKLKIRGCLFFGSLKLLKSKFSDLAKVDNRKGVVIIDLQSCVYFDASSVRFFQQEATRRESLGGKLILWIQESQLNDKEKAIFLKSFTFNKLHDLEQGKKDSMGICLVELQVAKLT